ncbi:AraC family transcriptional regulator [Mangrovimicrobium sediminis]|uniref:AraC family transcriptional regulator n=1 Tax=Mangrovimicrobium sediminis TaxID=2562682 RepID=A0A4Z0M9R6_9GAMM|nr:AraC family transcriptional regulator [Haliea sp. SAOS-164]TGD76138.1 AraC family transcriptional regulator [Haliea sp. SAOS-164]
MQAQFSLSPTAERPLVPCPGQGKLRAGYLRGFTDLISSFGADPSSILAREGIDPQSFDDPDQDIECIAAVNLLEFCSSHFQDPLFGLRLAEIQDPDVYGCVMAMARAAPNLRQALQCLVDYVPTCVSPEAGFELATTGGTVELRWSTNVGMGRLEQVNLHGMLLNMKMLHILGGEHFRPRYANLTCSLDRASIRRLQDQLGCRVRGGASSNAIAFSADALDQPLASANRMLFGLLGRGLAELCASARASFREQVEACVRQAISSGQCSADDCAEQLGTSTRTLQKRLARLGVKFSDIAQEERIKLAKHALTWSDFSLDEIASRLGYSEQTSFGRAFKRATGMTPKAYRNAAQDASRAMA